MGETLEDELTATGRRKRKDTGAKREGAAKGWTEEEERLFLEGLELYGREWHKAAAHVGLFRELENRIAWPVGLYFNNLKLDC